MRNNYSAADHDPGDEDPTERVKRALLEVIDDDIGDLLCQISEVDAAMKRSREVPQWMIEMPMDAAAREQGR